MKKMGKRAAALLLTICMILAISAVPTFAGTKSIRLKGVNYSSRTSDMARGAKTVKKGTYLVKPAKNRKGGFMRFVAPATKQYTFTFSHYATNKSYCNGYAYIMVRSSYSADYYTIAKVKTQGGKTTSLYLNNRSNTTGKLVSRFISSRYGKIKLTKGQTVYIYLNYTDGTEKLKIK